MASSTDPISHGPGGSAKQNELSGHFISHGDQYPGSTFHATNMHVGGYVPPREADPMTNLKRALHYPAMHTKEAYISSIRTAPFDWIWTETSFPQWLEGGEGIYWISGKPGSGKSTLMHHLACSDNVKQLLRGSLMRHDREVLVVHFYFDFRADSGLANDTAGMMRAILLQCIHESDELAQSILGQVEYCLDGDWKDSPHKMVSMLQQAIVRSKIEVVAFLDGLDEYIGPIDELLDLLIRLDEEIHIKLCLASRPEPEIHAALADQPKLIIQDHNTSTIRAYVEARLKKVTIKFTDVELESLASEISQNAEGITLWAKFAADEAARARSRGLSMSEIAMIMRALPSGMKAIYERIWRNLTDQEKLLTAAAFRLIDQWHVKPMHDELMLDNDDGFVEKSDEITSDVFCVRWASVAERLVSDLDFGMDFHLSLIETRISSLVKGLITFVFEEKYQIVIAGFVHKTLQTFLDEYDEYKTIERRIQVLIGPVEPLGIFYAQIIHEMSGHLRPKVEGNGPFYYYPRGEDELEELYDEAAQDWECTPSKSCRVHQSQTLPLGLSGLWKYTYLDTPIHHQLLFGATHTWLFRFFGYADHRGLVSWDAVNSLRTYDTRFPSSYPEVPGLLVQRFDQAVHRLFLQHSAGMDHQDYWILAEFCLEAYTGRRIQYQVGDWLREERLVELIRLAIHSLPVEARWLIYLTQGQLLYGSVLPGQTILQAFLSSFSLPSHVQKSFYWDHAPTHLLCVWAWAKVSNWFPERDKANLNFLLGAGFDVNHQVFNGGNVLHALLYYDPLDEKCCCFEHKEEHGRRLSIICHLSKEKFNALLANRVDIFQDSGLGTPLDIARQSLVMVKDFSGNRAPWIPDWTPDKANTQRCVTLLETVIIPTLESRMQEAGKTVWGKLGI